MVRLVAALLAAASCVATAQAQTAPPAFGQPTITLDDALRRAGAASPITEAANAGVEAAQAAGRVARLRPNPSLSIDSENVVGTGPYRGFNQAETTVSFALPVELGGKRSARIGLASARIGRAELEARIALADLRLRITQAYIGAAAAERRRDVALDQLRIANEALRVASDRVQVGAASPIDQQRAAVAQVNAQANLERFDRGFQVARESLVRLIGSDIGALDQGWFGRSPVAVPAGPEAVPAADGTLAYAAAQADLRIAEAGVRVARSDRIPNVNLSAGTRRLSATGDTAAVVGVSIPLPLFNTGRASLDQARAERVQADARRRLARLDAEQDIAAARRDRDNAAASVRASGPALAAANEAARIARLGYGQGKFDQLILLDAERTLAETRSGAIDALADYHDAEARLARLTAPAPDYSGDNR